MKTLVVGNGPSSVSLGDRINNFDYVVRFNNYQLVDGVGERTDLHLLNGSDKYIKRLARKDNAVFLIHPSCFWNKKAYKLIDRDPHFCNYVYTNDTLSNAGLLHLQKPPEAPKKKCSTGLVGVLYLLSKKCEVHIIGFDGRPEGAAEGEHSDNSHYYDTGLEGERKVLSKNHDIKEEQRILQALESQGKVHFLNKP